MEKKSLSPSARENKLVPRPDGVRWQKGITPYRGRIFRKIIYQHYRENPRILPWRKTRSPYRILISEIMLQQTQVERVIEKYRLFVRRYPGFPALSEASLADIFGVWQGLGYNRRALALKRIAETVMRDFKGRLPRDEEELIKLPGIGKYTASAVYTFVQNKPSLFIETNIRRVFIHFFFEGKDDVRDDEILPIIGMTLDNINPREWYYALMDYGVMLKKSFRNPNRRSAHYQRQSPFNGSNRQVRGMILKTLVKNPGISSREIVRRLNADPERVRENLERLKQEGFLTGKGRVLFIA